MTIDSVNAAQQSALQKAKAQQKKLQEQQIQAQYDQMNQQHIDERKEIEAEFAVGDSGGLADMFPKMSYKKTASGVTPPPGLTPPGTNIVA
jgi:hypothetical protein